MVIITFSKIEDVKLNNSTWSTIDSFAIGKERNKYAELNRDVFSFQNPSVTPPNVHLKLCLPSYTYD